MQYFRWNPNDKGSHHLSLMTFLHVHSYNGISQVLNGKKFTSNELSTTTSYRNGKP